MQKERLQFSPELIEELATNLIDFKHEMTKFIEKHNDEYECFTQDVFHIVLSDIFVLMMQCAPNYSSLKALIETSWEASLHCVENID